MSAGDQSVIYRSGRGSQIGSPSGHSVVIDKSTHTEKLNTMKTLPGSVETGAEA